MNLYIRYFNNETFVSSVEEAIGFLRSIPEINVTPELEADLREYAGSDVMFPKRYKVRSHVYFIVIKTIAANMADFKAKKGVRQGGKKEDGRYEGDSVVARLNENHPGWYEGEVNFKRVVLVPSTGKHEYRDTTLWPTARPIRALTATTASWIICVSVSTIAASSPLLRERTSSSITWACGSNCFSGCSILLFLFK